MINTRNSKRTNTKMLKKDINITECGEGKSENLDLKKKKKVMCSSLYDSQANASRHRKVLTSLKIRATTKQNQTLHSQKLKRKWHERKINGNHPTKKRKEERINIESTGKQGLNCNKYIFINNFIKCQWSECSDQKTQSGRLDKKAKPLICCLQETHLRAKDT